MTSTHPLSLEELEEIERVAFGPRQFNDYVLPLSKLGSLIAAAKAGIESEALVDELANAVDNDAQGIGNGERTSLAIVRDLVKLFEPSPPVSTDAKEVMPDHAHDTCMCGDPMDGYHEGHSPLSMADYYASQDTREPVRASEERVCKTCNGSGEIARSEPFSIRPHYYECPDCTPTPPVGEETGDVSYDPADIDWGALDQRIQAGEDPFALIRDQVIKAQDNYPADTPAFWQAKILAAQAERDKLKEQVERLEEALKPFADAADWFEASGKDGFKLSRTTSLVMGKGLFSKTFDLKPNNFYEARTALKGGR